MKEMVTARQLAPKGSGKSVGKEGGQAGSFNHDDVTLRPELSQPMTILMIALTCIPCGRHNIPNQPDNCPEPVTWVFRQLVQTRRADYSISKQTEGE
jgi:hypothetical protein